MKTLNLKSIAIAMFAGSILLSSCKKEEETPMVPEPTENLNDDIFELAIRRVNSGQNIAAFETARDAFVAKLMQQDGTSNDREVQPVFDLLGSGLELDSVFIGMTQYKDMNTYNAIGADAFTWPEAGAFVSSFSPLVFEALQPLEEYKPVNLEEVAPFGSGQILEIAVRDLNAYTGLDMADYEAKRDAFITLLSQQTGFIKEIQWKSALNSNIVVGMTVYQSQAAAIAINSDTSFANNPIVTDFISSYPPTVFGALNTVLK